MPSFKTESADSPNESTVKLLKLPAEYFKKPLPLPGQKCMFIDFPSGKLLTGIVRKSVVGLSIDSNTLRKSKIVKIELEVV